MRLVGKSNDLLVKLVEWHKDDVMRISFGGQSVPMGDTTVYNYFDLLYNDGDSFAVGVESNTGDIVGAYLIEDVDTRTQRCKMHFIFEESARGKCLKLSATAIVNFLFNEKHLRHLYGTICATNDNALSFVAGMGWERVAVLPEYYCMAGKWEDGVMVHLTPELREF